MPYSFCFRESLQIVAAQTASETASFEKRIESVLNLVCFDLYHKRFVKAFETLKAEATTTLLVAAETELLTLSDMSSDNDVELRTQLALYHDLIGSYDQLTCKFGSAVKEYEKALMFVPKYLDSRLKLAMVEIEVGNFEKVISWMFIYFYAYINFFYLG
jgi:hypothetical protein